MQKQKKEDPREFRAKLGWKAEFALKFNPF